MTIDKLKYANYEEIKTWEAGDNVFVCPNCDEELFYTEEDALKFLKGK